MLTTINTTNIKNLSIALEALSRIPNVSDFTTRIQGLLLEVINEAEEQSTHVPVYSRPPMPPPVPTKPYSSSSSPHPKLTDDDIPF